MESGNAELAKLCIEKGVDINAVQKASLTALHIAAQDGYTDCAKVLLENGADVNLQTKGKCT